HRPPGGGDRAQAVEHHPGLPVLRPHHVIDERHRPVRQYPPPGAEQAQIEGGEDDGEAECHDGGAPPARRIPETGGRATPPAREYCASWSAFIDLRSHLWYLPPSTRL